MGSKAYERFGRGSHDSGVGPAAGGCCRSEGGWELGRGRVGRVPGARLTHPFPPAVSTCCSRGRLMGSIRAGKGDAVSGWIRSRSERPQTAIP